MAVKIVTILGSTGSVGTQTLDILQEHSENYHVRALVGGSNIALLAAQARKFRPELTVVADPSLLEALRSALAGSNLACAAGRAAVIEAAAMPAE